MTIVSGKERKMKRYKKLVFIGMVLLALVLTSGTFAYTYPGFAAATLSATISDEPMATYEPSAKQPDWNDILPEDEYDSEYLRPNAAGDDTSLTPSDPTRQNWELVSDENDATYVANDKKQYRRDLYTLSEHINVDGSETIINLTVYFRFAGDQGAKARAAIKTNETLFEGSEESHAGGGYVTKSYQWEENPATGQPWTWDEINALQAGVSLKSENKDSPAYCTQVYVVADYEFVITQGQVPFGNLYDVTPHPDYTGDMLVKIYLTNTSELLKAYQYLNMKLYVANSLEASKTPDYQILSIETGVVLYNIEGSSAESYTVEVTGGSYRLVSGDTTDWGAGWSITPEFYCEVTQR